MFVSYCLTEFKSTILKTTEKIMDVTFKIPSKWLISGPSGSGKTTFILKILTNQKVYFNNEFKRVFYVYGQSVPEDFKKIKSILFLKGLGEIDDEFFEKFNASENDLIIFDDLMLEIGDKPIIANLFTRISRNKNITVFLLVQNLFPKIKYFTDIIRNVDYIVVMKSIFGLAQIKILEQRIFDKGSKLLQNIYKDATVLPFSYLFIDMRADSEDHLRFRSNFQKDRITIFVPKK